MFGEWSLCMGSGDYVWGVVIMCGEWSLCVGSGHYVWGVVIMCGEWSLCMESGHYTGCLKKKYQCLICYTVKTGQGVSIK
jgi:hypothetical protein